MAGLARCSVAGARSRYRTTRVSPFRLREVDVDAVVSVEVRARTPSRAGPARRPPSSRAARCRGTGAPAAGRRAGRGSRRGASTTYRLPPCPVTYVGLVEPATSPRCSRAALRPRRAASTAAAASTPTRIPTRLATGGMLPRPGTVSVMAATAIASRVESLVGDLGAVRAPRGTELRVQGLASGGRPADALQQPRSRGGRGSHPARRLRRLRPGRTEPRGAEGDRRDAPSSSRTTRRCSSRAASRSAVFRTHPGAPRVLIANSLLVPRFATWDEFRRLEAEGLTMFGQMTAGSWIYIGTPGDPPGHLPDVRRRRRDPLGLARPGRAHRPHGRARRDGRRAAAGRVALPGRRASTSRSTRTGSSAGSRRATSTRSRTTWTTPSTGCGGTPPTGRGVSVGLLGNAADVFAEIAAPRRPASTSSPTRRRPTTC